jgi:hypothetical protein
MSSLCSCVEEQIPEDLPLDVDIELNHAEQPERPGAPSEFFD